MGTLLDILAVAILGAFLVGFLVALGWMVYKGIRYRGVRFNHSKVLLWPMEESLGYLLARMTPLMAGWGYRPTSQSQAGVVFSRSYRPAWLVIPCLIFFPIGLLSLLYKKSVDITFSLHTTTGGSHVEVTGEGPSSLRDAISAELAALAESQ